MMKKYTCIFRGARLRCSVALERLVSRQWRSIQVRVVPVVSVPARKRMMIRSPTCEAVLGCEWKVCSGVNGRCGVHG